MKYILVILLLSFTCCTTQLVKGINNECSKYTFNKNTNIFIKDESVDFIDSIPGRLIVRVSLVIPKEFPSEISHIYLWPSNDGKDFCEISDDTEVKFCEIKINKEGFSVVIYMDGFIKGLDLNPIKSYVSKNICG
ncbi:MAG: hypothetical protein HRU38_23950 [Saccharospirillaceae bacterium]|nr:hypothetical protein [Pseudomonadales bacterium]NRB81676.1 hypothetical protein [Saccharospirillaceae bacterium]